MSTSVTRRDLLRKLGSGTLVAGVLPSTFVRAAMSAAQQAAAPAVPGLAQRRAMMGSVPIQSRKLSENLTMLSGPGGNVVVLNGADGKVIVDTFVQPAWAKLKENLDGISSAPIKLVINTHWHFDHTDNNASLHAAGATVLAHENTKKDLAQPHDLLGMHIDPSPADALPTQTFSGTHKLNANGEALNLAYIPPAHTDSDIYVHYEKANVIHAGDVFFNGFYPFIDASTGGNLSGMIAASDRILPLADKNTQIVPGHGPLGNKADLTRFRDMLATVRDRLQKLKTSGKSVQEAVAAKPLEDLDPVWGKGFTNGDGFVQLVYPML